VLLTVGKAGLTEAVSVATAELLARQELVKVRLPAGAPAERKVLAEELARAAGALCVGTLGRTALLYRPEDASAVG
jgi:RNA-binding protein YhbY